MMLPAMAEAIDHPAADGPEPAVLLPHRGRAVVVFALVAIGCLALAALGWLALKAELVIGEDPEGELVGILSVALVVACVVSIVAAWSMGAGDLRRMADGRMDPAGKGWTRCGLWLVRLLVLAAVGYGLTVLTLCLIDLWQTYVLTAR